MDKTYSKCPSCGNFIEDYTHHYCPGKSLDKAMKEYTNETGPKELPNIAKRLNMVKCQKCGKRYSLNNYADCPHCDEIKNRAQDIVNNLKWTASHLSANDEYDGSKSGLTYDEALNHVLQHACSLCKQEVEDGGYCYEHQDSEGNVVDDQEWSVVFDIMDTACGAEWMIETDEHDENLRYQRLMEYIYYVNHYYYEDESLVLIDSLLELMKQKDYKSLEKQFKLIDKKRNDNIQQTRDQSNIA